MAVNRIILNETSYHGAGSRAEIATEVKRRGFKKAFFVTDKDLIRFGVAKEIEEVLEKASIPYEIFCELKANPTVTNVQAGVDAFKKSGADFILALGGGSAIDTAKGIGIIVANPEFYDVVSLEGVAETRQKSIPLIAIPTTAGTAAEVTINYVITDEKSRKKMVCVDPNDIPVVAIIDPELMYSMPKGLTAATGMDALTHAIESFLTPGAWEMSDMFEVKAMELVHKHLKNAVDYPEDKEAREGMALAQYIAGMGFSNVGLGIVHSMAHPLGAFYDTPHGVANALLLPYVMEFNAQSDAGSKYKDIAKAFGIEGAEKMSVEDGIEAAVNAVKQLSLSIRIPQKLREIGVKEGDIPELAQAAFNDVCTGGNPRPVTVEEIEALYRKAL
ncbi:MAG: lactaldehyde reductase [Candidatus Azobacteroides sp.]|nr:lactaldehyde reductase [Candidatus Azobacteroides sp.]